LPTVGIKRPLDRAGFPTRNASDASRKLSRIDIKRTADHKKERDLPNTRTAIPTRNVADDSGTLLFRRDTVINKISEFPPLPQKSAVGRIR